MTIVNDEEAGSICGVDTLGTLDTLDTLGRTEGIRVA